MNRNGFRRWRVGSAVATALLVSWAASGRVEMLGPSNATLQRGGTSDQVSKASMDELTIRRNVLTKVLPSYPPGAVKRRVQGTVVASILISTKGSVALAEVL